MSGCLCTHCPGGAGSTIGNMSYNSRGDALTTVYGFLRGLLMYLQPEYNCISRETVSYTSRGTIPHIIPNYPRAHYNAGLNTSAAVCRRRCYSTARLGIPPRVAYVSPSRMQLYLKRNCILPSTRGTIPHIIPNYPRAHYNAGLNTSAAVCRRRCLIRQRRILASAAPATKRKCADGRVLAGGIQTRVCRRKCSDRRIPTEGF